MTRWKRLHVAFVIVAAGGLAFSGMLTTRAADKAAKMTTRRASVPGGWLVLVQIDEEISLTFFPDAGRRWDDGSPSDAKPPKAGDQHEFDDIRAATPKARPSASRRSKPPSWSASSRWARP